MFAALLFIAGAAPIDFPRPAPTKPDEPLAKQFSAARAAEYLDGVGVNWTRTHRCITCHTNMPYLTARPILPGDNGWKEVRTFLEKDVESWSMGGKPRGDAYVVATAFALAFNDAQQTAKLHTTTRAALDRMLDVQLKSGEWKWLKCDWPPLEHDDYYGATLAALAVGIAPDHYAATDKAKAGIEKLKAYFAKTPPPDLHHTAMLLWASTKLPGLMTADDRQNAIAALRAKQQKDGGWSLPSLGKYMRHDKTANDSIAESDGYGTGFITYVLLQAGAKSNDASIAKAVKWLITNQRESGRWFTRSLSNDKAHYIANAGSAFCVLALNEAGEKIGQEKTPTPAEQLKALNSEFGAASRMLWEAKTDQERAKAAELGFKAAPRFLELAEKYPNDPVAFDALVAVVNQVMWIENNTLHPGYGKDNPAPKAFAILIRDHLKSDKFSTATWRAQYGFSKECETLLHAAAEKSPHKDIRALAALRLAQFLHARSHRVELLRERPEMQARYEGLFGKDYIESLLRRTRAETIKEIETAFEQAAAEYGGEKHPWGGTIGERAKSELHEIRDLAVGKPAPDIGGEDQDGKGFKLSDYRGKVVLLYFWQEN